MATPPRILVVTGDSPVAKEWGAAIGERLGMVVVADIEQGLRKLHQEPFDGLCLLDSDPAAFADGSLLLQAGGLLAQLPDGVALLDHELRIVWANPAFRALAPESSGETIRFYAALPAVEILGPDLSPFHTAFAQRRTTGTTLKLGEKTFYHMQVSPVASRRAEESPRHLVLTLHDISGEVLQRQKLNAIYHAGLELGGLSARDLVEMSVQDRIELLKSRIINYTQDLLEFDIIEIRLLERNTQKLLPLLGVGMRQDAADRELFASPTGNGVTGFVAATGKSYLCEDTTSDPLYLPGAPDARSSLTVPLVLHDQILGTFNVESPKAGAFTEHDLQFLELFSREVASAINTLELLAVEKMSTATQSIELILREVARPVDEILNDSAWILERYIGCDANLTLRLQRILDHVRDVKQQIQRVGESMAPEMPNSPLPMRAPRPKLRNRRVLVADNDEAVRKAAHELLGRYGCVVETAHNGEEALLMARRFHYDAVLADIRLPDMSGFDCFCLLRENRNELPVILMTGFGYDPGHSIVKAKQRGLRSVLFKPFRVDQLLDEVEKAFAGQGAAVTNSGDAAGTTVPPTPLPMNPNTITSTDQTGV